MSTPKRSEQLDKALAHIPKRFRDRISEHYLELKHRLVIGDPEAAGLQAGKFCEIVLRILQKEITGSPIPLNRSIGNFANECRLIIQAPRSSANESLRTVIPRALVFLYTMRNKRSIGHVSGDLDPNEIDASTIVKVADWVMCELIRCFHQLPIEDAQELIDELSERQLPDIWEVGGRKRVLRPDLGSKDKTLLLLYSCKDGGALVEDLLSWVRYSSMAMFKKRVIIPLDANHQVDFDEEIGWVTLSPLGAARVEDILRQSSKEG